MNLRTLSYTRRPSSIAATIVAKLSSVSTIVDASRATSVPERPIATPMSARRSAGASLTPSPVIATTWPSGAQRLGDPQLGLRGGCGRRSARRALAQQLVAARARGIVVELGAVDRAGRSPPMPDLPRDRRRGQPVVAGDDDDPDARPVARATASATSGRGGSPSPPARRSTARARPVRARRRLADGQRVARAPSTRSPRAACARTSPRDQLARAASVSGAARRRRRRGRSCSARSTDSGAPLVCSQTPVGPRRAWTSASGAGRSGTGAARGFARARRRRCQRRARGRRAAARSRWGRRVRAPVAGRLVALLHAAARLRSSAGASRRRSGERAARPVSVEVDLAGQRPQRPRGASGSRSACRSCRCRSRRSSRASRRR